MSLPYDIQVEELDENDPQVEQPSNIKVKLWSHQLTLLKKCIDFENNRIPLKSFKRLRESNPQLNDNDFLKTQVGVIGDKVGSGKSFVLLSLLAVNDISHPESTIKSYANNKIIMCFTERSTNIKTNLIVVPHNLVSQWESYIEKFSDNFKYLVISKSKHLDNMLNNESEVPTYDIIVVNATFYQRMAHFLTSRSYKMQRVIYDEVDNINLPNCVNIESNFYWFISASYGNMLYPRGYNRLDYSRNTYIWYAVGLKNSGFVKDLFMNIHHNMTKEFARILVLKNSDEYVQNSVSLHPVKNNYILCKTPIEINILNGYVDRSIIQSLNAGDITTALQRIAPSHRNTEENLINLQVEKYIRDIKNCDVRIETTRNIEYDSEEQKQQEIARLTKKRDELQTKVNGIRERIHDSNTCTICYDDIKNKTIAPCCSNPFCFICINLWLTRQAKCPLCKASILPNELLVCDEQAVENEVIANTPPETTSDKLDKLENLEVLLKQFDASSKVIIYSCYDMSFAKIVTILDKLEISYAYLKGNESHIRKTVDRYKHEDLNVLLVSGTAYGAGLNLENTTDIIMFHKIDSEMEKQVIGRAQRYPRSQALNVHYLLYENEMRP